MGDISGVINNVMLSFDLNTASHVLLIIMAIAYVIMTPLMVSYLYRKAKKKHSFFVLLSKSTMSTRSSEMNIAPVIKQSS